MRDTGSDGHQQFSLWHVPKGITKNAMTKKKKSAHIFYPQGFPVTELPECLACRLACHYPGEDLELRIRRLLRPQAV